MQENRKITIFELVFGLLYYIKLAS